MKIYINGELQEKDNNLVDLIELVENFQIECKKSKKILEIWIDDKAVEKLPIGLPEENVNKVELVIKSALELIIESMIEGVQYLPTLNNSLKQSVTMFQQANIGRGIEFFQKSIDGLIWLNQLLTSIKIYLLNDPELNLEKLKYQGNIDNFENILKDLLKAWENEDYILISDLIEYELQSLLEDWKNNFVQILDELAGVK